MSERHFSVGETVRINWPDDAYRECPEFRERYHQQIGTIVSIRPQRNGPAWIEVYMPRLGYSLFFTDPKDLERGHFEWVPDTAPVRLVAMSRMRLVG